MRPVDSQTPKMKGNYARDLHLALSILFLRQAFLAAHNSLLLNSLINERDLFTNLFPPD